MESILTNIKKLLGVEENDESFDPELVTHINSVLSRLTQLGVGPKDGFSINDKSAVWSDFIGARNDLNDIRSYTYLKVRLIFDPPQNSFLVSNIKEQCAEYEWLIEIRN